MNITQTGVALDGKWYTIIAKGGRKPFACMDGAEGQPYDTFEEAREACRAHAGLAGSEGNEILWTFTCDWNQVK